eukprot:TRINITY_DN47346_c0_g1_i1.p1 TRINITY_DN47346_c0_g1~~TRINITY_DN47346_c0_g1_i1.p1  ORF type:complete len:307 (-),score=66.78 TRINITY_DN47346_c0_g1_i1:441-1361(-)
MLGGADDTPVQLNDTGQSHVAVASVNVSRQLFVLEQILRSLNSNRIRKRSYYRDADTLTDIILSIESLSSYVQKVITGPDHPQWQSFVYLMNQISLSLQWYSAPKRRDNHGKKSIAVGNKRSSSSLSSITNEVGVVGEPCEVKHEYQCPGNGFIEPGALQSFQGLRQNEDEYVAAAQLASMSGASGVTYTVNDSTTVCAPEDVLLECYEEMLLESGEVAPEFIPYFVDQDGSGGSSSWNVGGAVSSSTQFAENDPYVVGFTHGGGLSPFKPYNREQASLEAETKPCVLLKMCCLSVMRRCFLSLEK